jgi:hypothetical protein
MEWQGDRVYAYGVCAGAGSIECIDCGYRREHGRGPLSPCPRFRDSTHVRAGWRLTRRDDESTTRGADRR